MITLVSVGNKSSKSTTAEDLIIKSNIKDRYYLATMIPFDLEDLNRIKKHQEDRKDKDFKTIEVKTSFINEVNIDKNGIYLLDSLTAFVLNVIFKFEDKINNSEFILNYLKEELDYLMNNTKELVIVSDYIFNDFANYTEFTKSYLKLYTGINKYIAEKANNVIEVKLGLKKVWKGSYEVY